jgi:hypothetical protein
MNDTPTDEAVKSARYDPPNELMMDTSIALGEWHQGPRGWAHAEQRHDGFEDTGALTHCICFGAMYRTLIFLHEHPEMVAGLLPDGWRLSDPEEAKKLVGAYVLQEVRWGRTTPVEDD